MKHKLLTILLVLVIIAGVVGAALSVGMVISAVQFSEWGRVVLYCVTTGVCVEAVVLAIGKLKNKETS